MDPAALDLHLVAATPEQLPLVANLLELYAYDFSEFYSIPLGPEGRFGFPELPLYWIEPTRHPFLMGGQGQWAGLVLVTQGSRLSGDPAVWDMTEFFVMRRHRGAGLGTRMAHAVWQRFPGVWEVRVMESNPVLRFWQHAIPSFTGQPIAPARHRIHHQDWSVFSFHSGQTGPAK